VFHATVHFEAEMASFDDWVKELLEFVVRLEIAGVAADE
jgi:hypothetical protein